MFNSKFKSLIQAVHDGTTYLPNKFPRRYSIRIQIRLEYRVYHREGLMISNGNDMEAVFGIYSRGEITGNHIRIWLHEKTGRKMALEVIRI